jgi:hypothetical protein
MMDGAQYIMMKGCLLEGGVLCVVCCVDFLIFRDRVFFCVTA